MHKIDTMFATAQNAWQNGNPTTGMPATGGDADFFNDLQDELCNIVTEGGLTPSKSDHSQIVKALKRIFASTVLMQSVDSPAFVDNKYFRLSSQAMSVPANRVLDVTVCVSVLSDNSKPKVNFWLADSSAPTSKLAETTVQTIIQDELTVKKSCPMTVRLVLPSVSSYSRQIYLYADVEGEEIGASDARISYRIGY